MKNWSNPSIVMQHLHSNPTRNTTQRPLDSLKPPKKDRASNATLKKLQSERKIIGLPLYATADNNRNGQHLEAKQEPRNTKGLTGKDPTNKLLSPPHAIKQNEGKFDSQKRLSLRPICGEATKYSLPKIPDRNIFTRGNDRTNNSKKSARPVAILGTSRETNAECNKSVNRTEAIVSPESRSPKQFVPEPYELPRTSPNENPIPPFSLTSHKEDARVFFTLVNSLKNKLKSRKTGGYVPGQSSEKAFATTLEDNSTDRTQSKEILERYASERSIGTGPVIKTRYMPPEKQKKETDQYRTEMSPSSARSLMLPDESSLNCMKVFMKDLKHTISPQEDAVVADLKRPTGLKLQHLIKQGLSETNTRNIQTGIEEAYGKVKSTFTPQDNDVRNKCLTYRKTSMLSPYHIRKAEPSEELELQPLAERLSSRKKRLTLNLESAYHSANNPQPFAATPRQLPLDSLEAGTSKFKVTTKHITIKEGRHIISCAKDIRTIKARSSKVMEKISEHDEQSGGDNHAPTHLHSQLIEDLSLSKIDFNATRKGLHILDKEMLFLFPLLRSDAILPPPKLTTPEILFIDPTISL